LKILFRQPSRFNLPQGTNQTIPPLQKPKNPLFINSV